MKTLLVYDSVYGNTEKIAQIIGNVLRAQNETQVLRIGDFKSTDWKNVNLLIVGSPTQQFRATPTIKKFLGSLRKGELNGIQVGAFDTRLGMEDLPSRILPPFVKIFGYAARPIADGLVKKGGKLVVPPEGFYVKGTEGPLLEGEVERAMDWAKQIILHAN